MALQALGADALSGEARQGDGDRPRRCRRVAGTAAERDRRYVYAPLQGQLTLGTKGEESGPRETAQGVLDDILALFEGDDTPGSSK